MGSFEDYVEARSVGLLRLARALTGSTYDAEDLAQAALLKCLARWDSVQAADDEDAYVRRVMVNEFIEGRRRFRRWLTWASTQDAHRRAEVDPAAAVVERDAVLTSLQRLTVRQRAVLVLRYYEDLDDPTIAVVLGCSRSTVRSLAARALAELRTTGPTDATEERSHHV